MAIDQEIFEDIDKVLTLAQVDPDKLTEWEQGFVDDFIEKLDKYKLRTNISPRQYEVLERIRKKLED